MGGTIAKHMLSNSDNVGLELIEPKEGEGEKTDGTHHAGGDGAVFFMKFVILHQFFLSTTAERAGM
jgi:hypothetical protein